MDLKSNFNKICRICMKKERQMFPIFNNSSKSIFEKLIFCTAIKIENNDGLPTLICKTCYHNLNIAHQFKELSEQTDVILRKCLSTKEEPIDETSSLDDIISFKEYSDDSNSTGEENHKEKKVPNKRESTTSPRKLQFIPVEYVIEEDNYLSNKEDIKVTPEIDDITKLKKNVSNTEESCEQKDFDDSNDTPGSNFKCYICEICAKGFDTRGTLKAHVKRHEDVRPFQCEQCDKSFRERSTLKVHMRCHTGEKPFQCQICFKTFTQNSSLKSHVRSHTQETPYKCDLCGRTFTALSNYSKHCRAHRNERKFVCTVCGAAFNFNHGLKKHSMIHTGEKPFSCEICDKAFMRRTNLTTHMRIHNGEMPYTCAVCSKAFRYNSVLKSHLKSKHDIIIPPSVPLAEFHR